MLVARPAIKPAQISRRSTADSSSSSARLQYAAVRRHVVSFQGSICMTQVCPEEYEATLRESRQGFAIYQEEPEAYRRNHRPLPMKQGQSIHHICIENADDIM